MKNHYHRTSFVATSILLLLLLLGQWKDAAATPETTGEFVAGTGTGAVREEPDLGAKILYHQDPGTTFTVIDVISPWVQIRITSGAERDRYGWANQADVKLGMPARSTVATVPKPKSADTSRTSIETSAVISVTARSILVGKEEEALANELVEKIKAGEDFGTLCKTYSKDLGSKDKGGLYEDFPRGRMVQAFEDACFNNPPGSVVGPVKTHYGFHVIKVESQRRASVESVEILRLQTELARTRAIQRQVEEQRDALAKRAEAVTPSIPNALPTDSSSEEEARQAAITEKAERVLQTTSETFEIMKFLKNTCGPYGPLLAGIAGIFGAIIVGRIVMEG